MGARCKSRHWLYKRRNKLAIRKEVLLKEHAIDIAASINGFLSSGEAEKTGRQTGFIKRNSGKITAQGFLTTLLVTDTSQGHTSLPDLTAELRQAHGIEISKEALHQRFSSQAVHFLEKVIQKALDQHLSNEKREVRTHFSRIKVKDSTRFKLPTDYNKSYRGYGNFSKTNGMMSLQYEYDLISGNWLSIKLTDGLRNDLADAEQTISTITKGDLHIRDLGYISPTYLKAAIQSEAFFLNRLPPQAGVYYLNGKPLNWNKMFRQANQQQYMQQHVLVYDKERIACRMIIEKVPDHEFKRRWLKAQAKAKSKNIGISKKHKKKLHYNIYITNVDADILPASEVRKTYYLRWQIELVFKTWKSFFRITEVKRVKKERLECQLLGRLLWILINWGLFSRLNKHVSGRKQAVSMLMFFKRSLKFAVTLKMVLLEKLPIKTWLSNTYLPLIIDCVCLAPKNKQTHYQSLQINTKP